MKRIQSDFGFIVSLTSVLAIFCMLPFHGITLSQVTDDEKEVIILGKWTEDEFDNIIRESSKIADISERIDFLSKQFLNTNYKESTLIGNINTPEVFVVNLEGMDCFTYIDYVEAMRLSDSYTDFKENLKRLRYQSAKVDFLTRNHFFTDWPVFNKDHVRDVTGEVGGTKTKTVERVLNKKEDGTYFLSGIPVKQRKINYIPSSNINDEVIRQLKTGDYVGIYSEIQGLDVSHNGIIIKKGDKVFLRHASSREKNRKVVDEDFKSYIANKPGMVVFRPN
ncbi:MAG: DUF1460 domain-containing protein [Deltaproteobacteria bacterium]|nr:DUF1460 domain-containing protein [Deltaproteobacteria bacterium]